MPDSRPSVDMGVSMQPSPISLQPETRLAPLDLSPEGVRAHWRRLGVLNAIDAMEADESWAVDGQLTKDGKPVESVLAYLAHCLSESSDSAVAVTVANMPSDIVDLMGHVHSGRALSLFSWLTQAHGSAGSTLIRTASDSASEFGVLLLERVTALERQSLLARVFSPERMASLLDILDEVNLSTVSG